MGEDACIAYSMGCALDEVRDVKGYVAWLEMLVALVTKVGISETAAFL